MKYNISQEKYEKKIVISFSHNTSVAEDRFYQAVITAKFISIPFTSPILRLSEVACLLFQAFPSQKRQKFVSVTVILNTQSQSTLIVVQQWQFLLLLMKNVKFNVRHPGRCYSIKELKLFHLRISIKQMLLATRPKVTIFTDSLIQRFYFFPHPDNLIATNLRDFRRFQNIADIFLNNFQPSGQILNLTST